MNIRPKIEKPVCCVCGETLDTYMYEIDDEFYCSYCMGMTFMKDVDEWLQEKKEEIYEEIADIKIGEQKDETW